MTRPVYDQFGRLIAGDGPDLIVTVVVEEDEDKWYRMYD